MNLSEAMEATVTQKEARREIVVVHGHDWDDFVANCGLHDEYSGAQVLEWLGY